MVLLIAPVPSQFWSNELLAPGLQPGEIECTLIWALALNANSNISTAALGFSHGNELRDFSFELRAVRQDFMVLLIAPVSSRFCSNELLAPGFSPGKMITY